MKLHDRRHGFTLIEMVTSMIILGILLLACGSIVMMAGRATTDSSARQAAQLQAADAASQLEDDLNVAANFTLRTSNAATFTVPDRLNSGTLQVVSYSWSGTAGAPLYRQFNAGMSTAILPSVQNFSLSYSTRLVGPAPAAAEQTIASHTTLSGSGNDKTIDDKNWCSEFFLPSLSTSASTYTITRIGLYVKSGPQNAAVNVSLQLPSVLSRPSGTVIASATVYDSSMSSNYEWIDIPIVNASDLNPLQGLCIVVAPAGSNKACGLAQVDASPLISLTNTYYSTTATAGAFWSLASSANSLRFYVMGTVP